MGRLRRLSQKPLLWEAGRRERDARANGGLPTQRTSLVPLAHRRRSGAPEHGMWCGAAAPGPSPLRSGAPSGLLWSSNSLNTSLYESGIALRSWARFKWARRLPSFPCCAVRAEGGGFAKRGSTIARPLALDPKSDSLTRRLVANSACQTNCRARANESAFGTFRPNVGSKSHAGCSG
jgi:hypothetical protein